METELPATNAHGVVIRSEKFPLRYGDSFYLHSGQVAGTYRGYAHTAIPCRYRIESVHGVDGGHLVLQRTDHDGADPFRCSTHSVYAILTDEWSEYRKAGQ